MPELAAPPVAPAAPVAAPATPPAPAAPTKTPTPLKPGETRMSQSLGKLRESLKDATVDGKPIEGAEPPNRPGAVEPKPSEPAKEPAKPEAKEPVVEGKPAEKADGKDVPLDPKTGKPPGPWQLKERYEKLWKDSNAELVQLREKLAKMGDHETVSKRAQEWETKAKEYEEKIRKVDYTSHPEFQAKFEKPYQEAVDRTVKEMGQFAFTQEDGNVRAATFNDLVNLARVPDGKIDEIAEQWFGKSGQRVIAKIDKLRQLEESKQQAIESSQKEFAASREQETVATKTAREEAFKFWQESIAEDEKKHDFLRPKEEDDEWNSRLEKARDQFDEYWRLNPSDPKHTPEQRKDVMAKKANIKGRFIGFPMRGLELKRANATIATLQAELAQIKQTQPGAGNGAHTSSGVSISDPMDRAKAKLRQMFQES